MLVDIALIEDAAARLRDADASRSAIAPIRDVLGTKSDIDAAYAVQQINTDRWIAAGRRVSGRKIGVTSKAVQQQIGVDQPDFGTLFADTEYGDGIEIEAHRLIQPRAEAEVALVLERDLADPPHGFAEIIRAVAFALPAIEVVDSRIADWDISIVDTVADNASCGLYVVGSRPVLLSAFDARTVPMRMTVDGTEKSAGTGAACLGNPLHAARWLADTMCQRGVPLRAGDVIMTGSLGPLVPLAPGQDVVAEFGPLGTVTTRIGTP
ncbi:MAG TPA: fumarylacetoacetate hydrolase family protein [Acidimicrobiales bacterium]|nr:fumarylacetoacetate hydrolase family protein [Acidimicrobiales bacterium]